MNVFNSVFPPQHNQNFKEKEKKQINAIEIRLDVFGSAFSSVSSLLKEKGRKTND